MAYTYDDPRIWSQQPGPGANTNAPRGDLSGGVGGVGGGAQPSQPGSQAEGLGAASEWLGLSSGWRPTGYAVNRNAGYVGGSYADSQRALDQLNMTGARIRDGVPEYQKAYWDNAAKADRVRNAQMAGLSMASDAASMYRNAALGNGPSVAQHQLAQGLAQAQAQQASAAAGARGGGANFAAAQLAGAQQMGGLAMQANQQAAMLRAQEQLGAMQGYGAMAGQYGNLAGQTRAQDYQGQMNALQAQGLSMNEARAYDEMMQRQRLAEMQAQASLEGKQGDLALGQQQMQGQAEGALKSGGDAGASSIFGGILGGLASLSDERTKTDKRDASADIDEKLNKMRALSYRYNDEPAGTKRIGPMAQDMPPETVATIGGVRVVKMPAAAGFSLAAIARLNDRVNELEAKTSMRRSGK